MAAVWPGLVVPVFLGGEVVFPGVSLTFDEMQALATNLDNVVTALGSQSSSTEADTGDEGLSNAAGNFVADWAGKRDELTSQLTDLQTYVATIITAMKQADEEAARSVPSGNPGPSPGVYPLPTPPSRPQDPSTPPVVVPGWPAVAGDRVTAADPYPWHGGG